MEEKDRQGFGPTPRRRELAMVREHDEMAQEVDRVLPGYQRRDDIDDQDSERDAAPITITLAAPKLITTSAPDFGM